MATNDLQFFTTYCDLTGREKLLPDPAFCAFEARLGDEKRGKGSGDVAVSSVGRVVFDQLVEGMKIAADQAMLTRGKRVIAMIGNTGVGKSTAINCLAGCTMRFIPGGVIDVSPESKVKPLTKIGHRGSETIGANIHFTGNHAFLDTEGFLGTRGDVSEVIAPLSTKWALQNGESVKLVLCTDFTSILIERGSTFHQTLTTVFQKFANQKYEMLSHGLMILVTKVRRVMPTSRVDQDGDQIFEMPTIEWVRECIAGCRTHAPKEQWKLYDFILSDRVKICLHEPLKDHQSLLKEIDEMQPISQPQKCFNSIPYSSRTIDFLAEVLVKAVLNIQSRKYRITLNAAIASGDLSINRTLENKRKSHLGGYWVDVRKKNVGSGLGEVWSLTYSAEGRFQFSNTNAKREKFVLCLLDALADRYDEKAHRVHARENDDTLRFLVKNSRYVLVPKGNGQFSIEISGPPGIDPSILTIQNTMGDTRDITSYWVVAQPTEKSQEDEYPDRYHWSITPVKEKKGF